MNSCLSNHGAEIKTNNEHFKNFQIANLGTVMAEFAALGYFQATISFMAARQCPRTSMWHFLWYFYHSFASILIITWIIIQQFTLWHITSIFFVTPNNIVSWLLIFFQTQFWYVWIWKASPWSIVIPWFSIKFFRRIVRSIIWCCKISYTFFHSVIAIGKSRCALKVIF